MVRGICYSGALSIVNKKEMSSRREGGETSGREEKKSYFTCSATRFLPMRFPGFSEYCDFLFPFLATHPSHLGWPKNSGLTGGEIRGRLTRRILPLDVFLVAEAKR